jgi:XTP/dITP diphosphohydrolase
MMPSPSPFSRTDSGSPGTGRLVLATWNTHKVAELRRILLAAGLTVPLNGLDQFPGAPDVAETGLTFGENALLKARAIAGFTGLPSVADDSGLCVDVLNGMPGIFSARWSGRHGDDQANLDLVLAQIADIADPHRGAHFACAAALALPGGRERVVEGRLDGRLTTSPRGAGGFGYDPIFVPDGSDLTTAEMPPEAKDAISHRGRAFRALAPVIAEELGPRTLPTAIRLGRWRGRWRSGRRAAG